MHNINNTKQLFNLIVSFLQAEYPIKDVMIKSILKIYDSVKYHKRWVPLFYKNKETDPSCCLFWVFLKALETGFITQCYTS